MLEAAARWNRVEQLLDEALAREPVQRAAYLASACGGDTALRREVESLIAAAEQSGDFLEVSPLAETARPDPASLGGTPAGTRLGVWRLLRMIGRGGMGEVHEGERADGQFEQRVAIKLIRGDIGVSALRFHAERQLLARLEHPGIARLLDGGVAPDGRPYMVMEYVDGLDLRAWVANRALDLSQRLALFRQIVEAVAYAHRQLVVHRDLKPANVMVTSGGAIKLLDFGIASLATQGAAASEFTQGLMTPDFAPPELLEGGSSGTPGDVYSLGLMLHELLTGAPARQLGALPLVLAIRQILDQPLPLPSRVSRVLPAQALRGDLDALVAKALHRDPMQRYGTAEALLDDLERWQQGLPLRARGDGGAYVLSRFVRRHRVAVGAAALVLLSLLLGAAGIAWQAREARAQRDLALLQASRAGAIRNYLLHMFRRAGEEAPAGQAVSAHEVLGKAAARVREEFRDDPAAAQATLLELSELFFALRDDAGAETALREFLRFPGADPVEAANARYQLAEVRYYAGDTAGARQLLAPALDFFSHHAERYPEQLDLAVGLSATLETESGEFAAAVSRLEARFPAVLRRYGENGVQTALTLNYLGNAYSASGASGRALDAYNRALQVYERRDEGESADAYALRANVCETLLVAERLDDAAACYERTLSRYEALYGESAVLARALYQHGRLLLLRGEPEAALPPLERARRMGARFLERRTGLIQRMDLARIRAWTLLDRLAPAEAEARRQQVEIQQLRGPASYVEGLNLIEQARIRLRRGDADGAAALLDRAAPLIENPHGELIEDRKTLARLRSELPQ